MGSQHLYERCLPGRRETTPVPRYAASEHRAASGLPVAPARQKTRHSEGLRLAVDPSGTTGFKIHKCLEINALWGFYEFLQRA